MRRTFWLAAVFAAIGIHGCSSSSTPATPGGGGGTDAGDTTDVAAATDTGTPTGSDAAARTDAPATATSNAGNHCTTDADCGGALTCDTTVPHGLCAADCTEGSTTSEQAMCGGRGSTCLTFFDNTNTAQSSCRHACTPTARTTATGACPADFVCTGWWYTTMDGTPDSTGCEPFCTTDAQCDTANPHCNVRTGECGAAPYTATALADGQPCDPTVTVMVPGITDPVNVQCRGLCFGVSNNQHEGLCTSFINLRQSTACPDNPANTLPLSPNDGTNATDNLAICSNTICMTDSDCTRPLHCLSDPMGGPNLCDYLDNLVDGGTVVDAGASDAATDATTDATSRDATATDAGAPVDAAHADAGAPG